MPGWALLAFAYLLGSIPSGVIVARRAGVDLRQVGSGNIGATNVARALGKRTGVVVLLLDALKGVLAALAALYFAPREPWIAGAGLAAVTGHLFPVWLRMRGGKGVATSVGVLCVLVPVAGVAAALAYLVVYGRSRTSSLGSLAAATAALIAAPFVATSVPRLALVLVLFVTIVVTHRDNIARLMRGEEGRV